MLQKLRNLFGSGRPELTGGFLATSRPAPVDVLFLDFDGVLHPRTGGASQFSRLPLLVPLFDAHPDLRIVVSSDWRLAFPPEDLFEFLDILRDRVIGVTPEILSRDVARFPGDPLVPKYRQREILWFLYNHPEVRNWLVLDDIPDLFEENFRESSVLITDPYTGLTEADIDAIQHRLYPEIVSPQQRVYS